MIIIISQGASLNTVEKEIFFKIMFVWHNMITVQLQFIIALDYFLKIYK